MFDLNADTCLMQVFHTPSSVEPEITEVHRQTGAAVRFSAMQLCLTDLPWGDKDITGYNTTVDYSKLAALLKSHYAKVDAMSKTSKLAHLGAKRKRSTEEQEPIVVAMGDQASLAKLTEALAVEDIKVCIEFLIVYKYSLLSAACIKLNAICFAELFKYARLHSVC